jgi:hypothetical protein
VNLIQNKSLKIIKKKVLKIKNNLNLVKKSPVNLNKNKSLKMIKKIVFKMRRKNTVKRQSRLLMIMKNIRLIIMIIMSIEMNKKKFIKMERIMVSKNLLISSQLIIMLVNK